MWQTTANDIHSFSTWNSYHRWQTTVNETQASLTWNSCPYVANNSKWHTNMFAMKQLSICGNNSKIHTIMFDMKQLSICGKQQQMTHKHVSHETVIHVWQTTGNDIQSCLAWNCYPSCGKQQQMTHEAFLTWMQLSICGKQQQKTYNHVWHETVIHMWQTTANDITSIFDMNAVIHVCGKQQQKTYNHVWHETVIHVLFIYLFKIYFTFLISQAVKLTIYTGRKTKIFTYNMRK